MTTSEQTAAQRAALKELVREAHFIAAEYATGDDHRGIPVSPGMRVAYVTIADQLRTLADKMDALASRGTPSALAAFFGAPS